MRTVRPARPHSRFFRLSPLAASIALALSPAAALSATYVVTNTDESGAGSLNDAILLANLSCASDPTPIIQFNIPSGPFVISTSTGLPPFSCPSNAYYPTVDGTSQPGWSPNSSSTGFDAVLPIEISGNMQSGCGLWQYNGYGYGGMLSVQGLVIRDFNYGGSGTGLCGILQVLGSVITNNGSGIDAEQGSVIGDSSAAGRNVIAGNLYTGIYLSRNGSITNNLIGTFDGGSPASNGTGISSDYGPVTISGNVISGNTYEAIYLWGDGGSTISGNKIGTNAAGTFALGNGTGVVLDYSYGANITGNVISGNTYSGIEAYYDGGSTISGNSIGTNAANTAPIPNEMGITLNYSYGGTTISGNTISGNAGTGVDLYQSNGISITGNYVGTNSGGAAGLGNYGSGVSFYCSNGSNTISGNFIAGNSDDGIYLYGVPTSTFSGNSIGVGPTGGVRPNGGNGIVIDSGGSCGYQSDNNSFYNNQIANNANSGILLYSGVGNRISRSTIYDNGEKSIDINSNVGPTPNDPGDADTGPNNQQNWPVINSVTHAGGNTLVNITLDSAPLTFTEFVIEFFENPAPGTPAGRTYLSSYDLHIDNAPGPVSATVTLTGLHNFISTTATSNTTNDTSEFSPIASLSSTPAATLSASTLSFTTPVGATSPNQTVTVLSSGSGPYVITTFDSSSSCYGGPFCYGGDFTCSTTCTTNSPYATGRSCSVSANFHPSYLGRQSTTIYLCDNTSASPHTITLTGDGVVPPVITITPDSWDFGTLNAGFKSRPQTFVIDNPSGSPAVLGPPYVTGDFSLEGTDCGSTLGAGEHCSAQVSFIPLRAGYVTGELIVPIGDTPKRGSKVLVEGPPPSSARAALSGTGSELGHVQLPNAIDLGAYTLGSPPLFFTFELRNDGAQAVTVSSIATAAPFTSTNNCPQSLAVGQACTITVGFSTTVAGDYAGTLNIVTNAQDGSRAIPLTARAQGSPLPVISVSQSFVGFGDRMIGTESEPQRLTIRNNGAADATLQAIGRNAAGLDYLVTTTCGLTLAPAQTCFADVVFRPVGFGPRPGLFEVFSNTVGSPAVVELTGTGCRPFVSSGRRGSGLNCAP